MLQSGRYPLFYSDLLNIDPFSRQITSLALSKFYFKVRKMSNFTNFLNYRFI